MENQFVEVLELDGDQYHVIAKERMETRALMRYVRHLKVAKVKYQIDQVREGLQIRIFGRA